MAGCNSANNLRTPRNSDKSSRRLAGEGVHVYVPRGDEEYAMAVGLRMLVQRRLVERREGGWAPAPGEEPVLRYYAASLTRSPRQAA